MTWLTFGLGLLVWAVFMWLLARTCAGSTLIEQADQRGRRLNHQVAESEKLSKYRGRE